MPIVLRTKTQRLTNDQHRVEITAIDIPVEQTLGLAADENAGDDETSAVSGLAHTFSLDVYVAYEYGDVDDAGRRLLRKTRDEAVLLTRGARGMSLFRRRTPPLHVPAFGSDEVADVTGAGDTVIAVFTLALLAGADFSDAARLSNYAAGLVVMKAGTATIDPAELCEAIREDLGEESRP